LPSLALCRVALVQTDVSENVSCWKRLFELEVHGTKSQKASIINRLRVFDNRVLRRIFGPKRVVAENCITRGCVICTLC
jgi:hypothetical protein